MHAHNVYFTLNDTSPAAVDRLVQSCRRYLKDHPGITFFAVGTLADELDREVNDRDFQVGLHIVFADKAAHDQYQVADDHMTFIAEQKDNWKKVRVFDSHIES